MTVRMRHTRSHSNNRRSHHSLTKPAISQDASGNPHLRHRLSPTTGQYRGRKVLDLGAKLAKKAEKASARETAR